MANNPHIQDKVHQELDQVYGKEKQVVSLSDREKLPYTNSTMSEVQRCLPILPLSVIHETMQDVEVAGYFIPKDTVVSTDLHCQESE